MIVTNPVKIILASETFKRKLEKKKKTYNDRREHCFPWLP